MRQERDDFRTGGVTRPDSGNDEVSGICGAVTRSNLIVGRGALIGVALVSAALTTACGDRDAKQTSPAARQTAQAPTERPSGPAWTAAKAIREARTLALVVDGRRTRTDPTTIVCWGAGASERRGHGRVWRHFECIAPTFRGAQAVPDVLFELRPTGDTTSRILNARFSSYEPTASG